jgi:hypothetical protein
MCQKKNTLKDHPRSQLVLWVKQPDIAKEIITKSLTGIYSHVLTEKKQFGSGYSVKYFHTFWQFFTMICI